jgi:ABC-type antimicrobial peptide transport system permease subunit
MALGADGRRVRGLVLLQVARMLLVGGAVGIAGALLLGRAASSMLYGVDGSDATITASAGALLTLIAFAAGYLPASRASRVDPMVALRAE